MKSIFLHIDYNSYFATVEQQANPRLRGKPIGVTGGDRTERTVVGAASIEAKALGVKTGMSIQEARKIAPQLILVRGDSDKYLACTKRFLNILKDYSPYMEIFSIDEAFVELKLDEIAKFKMSNIQSNPHPSPLPPEGEGTPFVNLFQTYVMLKKRELISNASSIFDPNERKLNFQNEIDENWNYAISVAIDIKQRIKKEIGEWLRVSIGISYNKTLSKLAGSLYKPDGLHVIADQQAAIRIIDQIEFDDICGIGPATKRHLFNMGIFDFPTLRKVPRELLLSSFKSYGNFLYNIARGINTDPLTTFYEKEDVKSVGHQHTLLKDTNDITEIQQTLLKMSEMIAKRLRDKKLVGKTVVCFFRYALGHEGGADESSEVYRRHGFVDSEIKKWQQPKGIHFESSGMQMTLAPTDDGLTIFKAAWNCFEQLWDKEAVRLLGVSISNVMPKSAATLSLLPEMKRTETITKVLDKINNRFGDFKLRRAVLLNSHGMRRKPNPFLSDRRFKL